MNPPGPDWRNLGNCLAAARNGRSVPEIAAASGVSIMSIYAYESGRPYAKPPAKMWRLVNFYRWTPDSLDVVLAGGQPRLLPAATRAQAAAMMAAVRADPRLSKDTASIMCEVIASLVTDADPGGGRVEAASPNGTTAPPSD